MSVDERTDDRAELYSGALLFQTHALLADLVKILGFSVRWDQRGNPELYPGTTDPIPADVETVKLLRANGERRGATVYNDSAATLYLKLGRAAAVDDFTVALNTGDYYELPFEYVGVVTGVWTAATGQARVTELS